MTATDASRRFSDLLNRVEYRGESFLIERAGRAICEIGPLRPGGLRLSELAELLRASPKPDQGYWKALERLGREQPAVEPSPWER